MLEKNYRYTFVFLFWLIGMVMNANIENDKNRNEK